MDISRADFIKLLGVSLASLLVTRCSAPSPKPVTPRERLRALWLRLDELATQTSSGRNDEDALGQQMMDDHRAALDELVAASVITAAAADLVQEAYAAAIYHVWRSNAPITCYLPAFVDYAPASASVLVKQAEILGDLSAQGTIDPVTLGRARAALEHDMAFYSLTSDETSALYKRLSDEMNSASRPVPSFDELSLELTPDAHDAARFLLDLLAAQ